MQGYKKTKLGWIPEDWEVVKLEALSTNGINNGVFNDPKKVGKGYKLVNVKNMYSRCGIRIEDLTLLDLETKAFEKNKVVWGDIFFTRSSLVAEGIAYSNINLSERKDLTYDGHLMKISPNSEITNPLFLAYFFRSEAARKQFIARGKTGTMTTIGQKDISPVLIPLPPLPEQKRIAQILSTWDEAIETLEKLITQKQQLKKGLMQQLLTGQKRVVKGTGCYKKTKLGEIPEEWEVAKLGGVGEITSSKRILKSEYVERGKGIPFYRGKEVTAKATRGKFEVSTYISKERFNELSNRFGSPSEGDILVTAVGTIGSIYLVQKKEVFYFKDGNLLWIRNIKKEVNSSYLYWALNSEISQKNIDKISTGSSQKALTIVKLKKIFCSFPPLPEQKRIAEILSTCDTEIETLENQLAALQTQKKGLMQQLLTGQRRVKLG